jgi:hypothetical protein
MTSSKMSSIFKVSPIPIITISNKRILLANLTDRPSIENTIESIILWSKIPSILKKTPRNIEKNKAIPSVHIKTETLPTVLKKLF